MSPKPPPIPHAAWRNPVCFVALGFGAGGLPKAPGTWGTLLALPFYLLFMRLPFLEYVLLMIVLFAVGIWICGEAGKVLGVHGGFLGDHDSGAARMDMAVRGFCPIPTLRYLETLADFLAGPASQRGFGRDGG